MGVIVIEGILVTIAVLVGLREAIMNAVPVSLKRAIGVGIGLFILFIGFANGGLIRVERAAGTLVTVSFPTTAGSVGVPGWALDHHRPVLVMRIKAALVISILLTTILALIFGVATIPDASQLIATPRFRHPGPVRPRPGVQRAADRHGAA